MYRVYADYLITEYSEPFHPGTKHDESKKLAAVIIEDRPTLWFPLVVKNFVSMLGPEWNHYIFTTKHGHEWLKKHFNDTPTQVSVGVVEWNNGSSFDTSTFNQMMCDSGFWDCFKEEYVLTYQIDSLCCQPLDPMWKNYDYIGAPCGHDTFNGGLALRNVEATKECIKTLGKFYRGGPEDVFMTDAMKTIGGKLPNGYEAGRFALESYYYTFPFGVHGTDKYYHSEEIAQKVVEQINA